MASSAASLRARAVSCDVAGTPLLRDVDVYADGGRVVGIIGPNGSGKSTLVRCLSGLLPPSEGVVELDGRDVRGLTGRQLARRLAFVGQETMSDIDYRVADVVALARLPYTRRFETPGGADVCAAALDLVAMTPLRDRHWATLSGGERQRVNIARALAQEPDVLVLDEPLNHLDVRHRFDVLELLVEHAASVVVVLHDLDFAARYCDELVVLDGGRVVASGPAQQVITSEILSEVFGVVGALDVSGDLPRVRLDGAVEFSAETDR